MYSNKINETLGLQNATTNDDFTAVTPRKFNGSTGKVENIDSLVSLVSFDIDNDFRIYYRLSTPLRFRREATPRFKKEKPRLFYHTKVINKPKPDYMLTSADLETFVKCVDDVISHLPPEMKSSPFCKHSIERAVFDGLRQSNDNVIRYNVEIPICNESRELSKERKPEEFPDDVIDELFDTHPSSQLSFGFGLKGGSPNLRTTPVGCEHITKKQWPYDAIYYHHDQRSTYAFYMRQIVGDAEVKGTSELYCDICNWRFFHITIFCRHVENMTGYVSDIIYENPGFPSILSQEWTRTFRNLLLSGDIEENPGPFDLNGDTSRKSKRLNTDVDYVERLKNLSKRQDDIGKNAICKLEKFKKERRSKAAEKAIMKQLLPRTESLIEVNVSLFKIDFVKQMKRVLNGMPKEIKKIFNWADVGTSLYVILFDSNWAAKYLATSTLIRIFNVSGVTAEHTTMLLVVVACKFGIMTLTSTEKNRLKTEGLMTESDFDLDPSSTLISLILTFLMGGKPGKSRVTNLVDSVGKLPQQARGVEAIIAVVKKVLQHLSIVSDPDQDINDKLNQINEKVIYWLSKEGEEYIMMHPAAFDEVTNVVLAVDMITQAVSPTHPLMKKYRTTLYHLRMVHRKVLMAPRSGHSYRKEPVIIQLAGDAGIGKTYMVQLVAIDALKYIFHQQGKTPEQIKESMENPFQYVYWRPIGHKFETNYNSSLSKIYVMDDANQIDPDYLKDDLPAPGRLIHLKNNAELLLPVAELDSKRLAKFNSDVVIFTDNCEQPDLSFLADKNAYKRRIDLPFKVSLRDEFSTHKNGVRVCDPSKLPADRVSVDMWKFKHLESKVEYTYAEVIELLKVELDSAFNKYNNNHAHLLAYAQDLTPLPILRPINGNEVPVPAPRASTSQVSANVLMTNSEYEDLEETHEDQWLAWDDMFEQKEEDKKITSMQIFKHTMLEIFINLGAYAFLILTYIFFTSATWASIRVNNQDRIHSFKRRAVTTKNELMNRFTQAKIKCQLKYAVYKEKALHEDYAETRKRIFMISSACLAMLVAYKAWRPKSKTDEVEYENYSSGDPSSAQRNTPAKPKGTMRATRTLRTENELQVQRDDALKLTNNIPDETLVSESCYDNNMYALRAKVARQQFVVSYVNSLGKKNSLQGFFIAGRVLVVNQHLVMGSLPNGDMKEYAKGTFTLKGIRECYQGISARDVEMIRLEHGEDNYPYDVVFLVFAKNTGVRSFSDLSKSVMTRDDVYRLQGKRAALVTLLNIPEKNRDCWFVETNHSNIDSVNADFTISQTDGGEYKNALTYNFGSLGYRAQTKNGCCGSILMVNNPGFPAKICGIHMASFTQTDNCFAAMLYREMIDVVRDAFNETTDQLSPLYGTPGDTLVSEGKITTISDDLEHLTVIPDVISSPTKSKIRPSILHNKIFKTTKAPAKLNWHTFADGNFHVMNKAMLKYVGPSVSVIEHDREIFKSYLSYFYRSTRELRFFSKEVSIRGVEEEEYLKAINRSSSPGYPFVTVRKHGSIGKQEFLGRDNDFIYDHPYLTAQLKSYVDTIRKGQRPALYFTTTAKDELRTLDRVEAGKTRAFAAAPLHFVVLFRQYYLDMFSHMFETRIDNCSLMGINPLSKEWSYLVSKLTSIAHPSEEAFLAGDFTNFDGTLNQSLLWSIFEFIEAEYSKYPSEERDPLIAEAMWNEITNSRQIFGNTIINVTRGMPSGHPGTGPVNSLYNSALLFFVVYKILTDLNTRESFDIRRDLVKHMKVFVFGDDNILSFSKEIRALLDPSMIQTKMAQYGHIYTSDDKNVKTVKYVKLNQISILKRRFTYNDRLSVWMAPLELPSVLEPLNWDKVDDEYSLEKSIQLCVNIRTALRELSMHTKETFQLYQKQILEQAALHNLNLDPECNFSYEHLQDNIYEIPMKNDVYDTEI